MKATKPKTKRGRSNQPSKGGVYNEQPLPWSNDRASWFRSLVLFGDSSMGLIVSFLVFLGSIGIAIYVDHRSTVAMPIQNWELSAAELVENFEQEYQKLGPIPSWIETSTVPVMEWKKDDSEFEKRLKERFDQDGVVALRGILDIHQLDRLDEASSLLIQQQFAKSKEQQRRKPTGALTGRPPQSPQGTQFFTVKEGAIFLGLNGTRASSNDPTDNVPDLAFLNIALESKIPEIISQHLLRLQSNETLRMMRDIFLAKDADEYVCGWHVDDTGFWPADADASGVNAWIALDDMPIQGGGGFALAVGSHVADWRHDAYQVTGSPHTFPPEGFKSARDTVERRVGNGTCNIATAAPHLHRRMEETKRIYDVKRGDVIFHTRWLFHRTVPFDRKTAEVLGQEEPPLLYRRYSIRYGPGSSRIPRGYGTELSVLWDEANGGRTADEVAQYDAPWYPQAWPPTWDNEERIQLQHIATERLSRVTKIANSRRQQLRKARRVKHQIQPH